MYTHVVTGCTKIGNVQTGNVQNWKCTTTYYRMYRKLEMYKFEDVQTGDVQNLEMYRHVLPDVQPRATECTKKILSKPFNMGSSFEDLVATSPAVKTDL